MKNISIVVFIVYVITLVLISTAHSIFIIESQRTYPEVLTYDDDFTICVQIKKDHACQKDTISITYTYGSEEGELYPLKEYINRYHFKLDELPETYIWCGEATATHEYSIYTNFTCLDSLNNPRIDPHIDTTSYGYIYINTTSSFESQRIFGKYIGEQINIAAYLEDTGDITLYYTVYNIKDGIIPYILKEEMPKTEGQYKANFTIPPDAPYGFIELEAEGYNKKGGRFISYAAIPYRSEIHLLGETIMGSTIDLALDIDVEYGTINHVITKVILPNGTEEKINLDHVNTSTEYTIPMLPGTYTIESTINHTILDNEKTITTFHVREYELDIDSGIIVYEQGDTVTVKVGVISSNDTAIDMEINSICIDPIDSPQDCFDDSDTIVENKYHKLIYSIDDDAPTGEYSVHVSAEDKYGLNYNGNESFVVNEKDRTVLFTIFPSAHFEKINSMNATDNEFTVTNIGTTTMDGILLSIDSGELSKYLTIIKTNFTTTLDPGNATTFAVIIQPADDMKNKLYYGNISITSKGKIQKLPVTLDISLKAEMTIINKTISVEALKDKEKNIYVVIENAGTRPLTGITANMTGDIKEYEDEIETPDEITPGRRKNIGITLKPISKVGTYKGELEISADNASGKVEITVEVIEDFETDIDDVDKKRIAMNTRMDKLTGDTSSIEKDLTDLQAEITEMKSQYYNGQYIEAKSMLTKVMNRADKIDTALEQLESSKATCGDGNCDDSETCTSCYKDCKDEPECADADENCDYDGDCEWDEDEGCSCEDCESEDDCTDGDGDGGGRSPILIIIAIIVVVIIVAVVATSLVPDDNPQTKPLPQM
ncbi:MAG: hypothetical protein DRN71_04060 [Candidatus Nanohalarchaeota archaeon]|nr:MAG: hypothetical protein DRN71_04060 [Candidatus Nanohaloarchaeota archaeon]